MIVGYERVFLGAAIMAIGISLVATRVPIHKAVEVPAEEALVEEEAIA